MQPRSATRSRRRSPTRRCRSRSGSRRRSAGRATRSSRPARSRSPICSTAFRASPCTTPAGSRRHRSPRTWATFVSIRVFFDGFEMPVLDPRTRRRARSDAGQHLVARGSRHRAGAAGGARLHSHLARALDDAVTRTDVSTGDQQTNLYRGFFGRRYDGGGACSSEHSSTARRRRRSSAPAATSSAWMARSAGPTRAWSVDAFVTRNSRHRGGSSASDSRIDSHSRRSSRRAPTPTFASAWAIPTRALSGRKLMAVGSNYQLHGNPQSHHRSDDARRFASGARSLDTTISRAQYVARVGVDRGRCA